MPEQVATLRRRLDALAWLLKGARDPELIIKLRNELAEVRMALHQLSGASADNASELPPVREYRHWPNAQ